MTRLAYVIAALGSAAAFVLGIDGLLGHEWRVAVPWLLPIGGVELAMDRLGALFLVVVAGTAFVTSVYALDYDRTQPRGRFAYLLFVASMAIVPLAANVVTFLVAWELMSLASYLLVLRDRSRSTARAAWVYAVMTHAGFACLLAGMLLLGTLTGSFRFADWPRAMADLTPVARNGLFALLALAFAGKAGVIPFHVWLPMAHPAAPSHVSALMSGVMVKLGVYGLIRVAFEWLGNAPAWWGVVVLLAGAVSAVVGVLYALVDRDLKRLLAFSTIENVGIMLIGAGAAVMFRAGALGELAALALVAALYHVVNHAAFKALLFLGAGSVVHATGTRDMEAMGGLVKRMPWTSAAFLLGAVAIAGLPPLNGFVSEWLTFQALLKTLALPRADLNLVFTLGIAGLALTAGLAAAAFVKAFGITFLALPRSDAAAAAHEAPAAMRIAQALLALVCVALGVGPTVVLPVLGAVAASLVPGAGAPIEIAAWATVRVAGDFATLSPLVIAAALVLALVVPLLLLRLSGASRGRRTYETWGCGRLLQTARMEYTATAFSNPFKRIFDFFYRPVKRLDVEVHPASRLFVQRITWANPTRSIFDEWLYRPALSALGAVSERARLIQSGSANAYLAYILAALVLMLVLG
jgi:formate hydrogenlyase subunit 3/multisubunit Na+/H+ antiporter MnhD subunit